MIVADFRVTNKKVINYENLYFCRHVNV